MQADGTKHSSIVTADEPGTPGPTRAEQVLKLFLAHHARLVSFLRAKLGSQHEAEDLAQKAYEELLSVKRDDASSFFAGYLYRTATNLAINRLKERSRARELQLAVAGEAPASVPSPERFWVAHQDVEILQAALMRLPAKVRMVFMLRIYEELQYDEIVARMAVERIKMDRRTAMRYVERALLHCQRSIVAAEQTRKVRKR
jgi:RNA polymerase sigma factor (sigma-70 family)